MLICGIHDGHNAAASLVQDGRIIGALQEERVARIKNYHGFPEGAVARLLADAGASWNDVDHWVLAGTEHYIPPGNSPNDRTAQIQGYRDNTTPLAEIKRILRRGPLRKAVQHRRNLRRPKPLLAHGVAPSKISAIEHHRCHAATAYYGHGPDPQCLVITLDGAGDGLCATVSAPDAQGRLVRKLGIPEEHSVGILWALITAYAGMVPLEHEYKMMGMAPYASATRAKRAAAIFAKAFVRDGLAWTRAPGIPEMSYSYKYWRDALEFVRFDEVFAGLQLFTEEFIAGWIRDWLKETRRTSLRLSGGVFMNVKLNKVIGELPEATTMWVFPTCGDETNTMGAIWAWLEDRGEAPTIAPLEHLYLGAALTSADYDAAATAAQNAGLHVYRPGSIADAAAHLLASGEVIARCDGREEFGARALGNRSILADPSRPGVVRLINSAIKSRDFWMPFACSVAAEYQDRYLKNPKHLEAPYMILTFDSQNTAEIAGGCHPEDGTVRPQIVTAQANPAYHEIIMRFAQKTGRGAILNTSFNLHGEPIVSKPADAVDVLLRSGLRHLFTGPYMITKD